MLGAAASLAFLAALGLFGVAVLGRLAPSLDRLERIGYGAPLGATIVSLGLLVVASLIGSLSPLLVASSAVIAAIVALVLLRSQPTAEPGALAGTSLVPAVVLSVLALYWLVFWLRALTLEPDGLYVGSRYLYGDFAQHLGDVTGFAWGDNFPPVHPRFAGAPFAYHYLTSITSAALVELGLAPTASLTLPGFLFCGSAALAVHAFARRLTRDSTVGGLAVLLFFVGGGCGFWLSLRHLGAGGGLWNAAAEQAANFRWLNVFLALVAPQRGYLYGLPLGLLVLRLLWADEPGPRRFVVAGAVAGLLPLAHLGTLLSLALVTPILFALDRDRRFALFLGVWIALAAPQLWMQQGGGAGALAALRWAPGWVAAPDPWILFWLENVGLLLPLTIVGIVAPGFVPERSRRLLVALVLLFVIGNLFVFQPWDWDNTKILIYAFLAACILSAAVLVRAWRASRALRPVVALALGTLLASGVLESFDQALERDRHRLLDSEEIELARHVRQVTEPHAVFACGLQHNHPVPVLAGRRVLLGYAGWHWSQGLDVRERERELRAIYALGEDAPAILVRYAVSYVVVGPWEREHLGAKEEAFLARFPRVVATEHYAVFDVRAVSASSRTRSATRTPAA
jgi:hypothetical protein